MFTRNLFSFGAMNTTTSHKTVKILSRHAKLSEAVKAAKIDLSYNEPLALRDLAYHDKDKAITAAFVVERHGKIEVMFAFQCDILILNTYTPFHSCLDDSPFYCVRDNGDHLECFGLPMRKSASVRKIIAHLQKTNETGTVIYVGSKL